MDCQETETLLDAYLDDELDVVQASKVAKHLQTCQTCAEKYETLCQMQNEIRNSNLFFAAPSNLRKNIRQAVRQEISQTENSSLFLLPRWAFAGISLTFAALLIFGVFTFSTLRPKDELLTQEIVSGHVRSLIANHLIDVPSGDQHTVKPWFEGKLDFSPPVKDLSANDFTLVGGRLDYIGKRPVAALVYRRRQHFINLFVWSAENEPDIKEKRAVQQGYNVIYWTEAGMELWAVSDLNLNELDEFVQAFEK